MKTSSGIAFYYLRTQNIIEFLEYLFHTTESTKVFGKNHEIRYDPRSRRS